MGRNSNFSISEVEYLENNWGIKSINAMANDLNRSISSILNKKTRLQLGAFLDNGEYITVNQLFKAIGREKGTGYTLRNWIRKGFPVKNKKVLNSSFRVVYLEDFWKWAREYRMHIDFSKFKENELGLEPDWVKGQRRADIAFSKYKVTPWTKKEDSQLESLLGIFRYSYRELSMQILRTEAGIKRRINDLGLNMWPIRDLSRSWRSEEISIVTDMYNNGYKSDVIKEYINKSAQAINGKIERLIRDGILVKHK
ncbi:hypothetical protein [Clostridium kluyveri]|uniref:Uncharacterized protein n=1 Tax=Clostridium kluyveri TaxID=1534 RepID=A0A1L5FEC1_CLOKL|nr:hypothetical protein [Clostridium kluyveri]APM41364.1 hypothetical protein BS101_21900 [Clostridium kluyveri]